MFKESSVLIVLLNIQSLKAKCTVLKILKMGLYITHSYMTNIVPNMDY